MIRILVLALTLCTALAQTSAQTSAQTPITFPAITGENLEGQEFTFPADFGGDLNLVLIAFSQGQQGQVDTWLSYAEGLELESSELSIYEIPVLGSSYRLLRSVIDGGMRSGIDDPEARARTITFYGNKPAMMEALALETERTIHALLVKADGEVVWQAQGEAVEDSIAGLEAYLNKASLPADYKGGL